MKTAPSISVQLTATSAMGILKHWAIYRSSTSKALWEETQECTTHAQQVRSNSVSYCCLKKKPHSCLVTVTMELGLTRKSLCARSRSVIKRPCWSARTYHRSTCREEKVLSAASRVKSLKPHCVSLIPLTQKNHTRKWKPYMRNVRNMDRCGKKTRQPLFRG